MTEFFLSEDHALDALLEKAPIGELPAWPGNALLEYRPRVGDGRIGTGQAEDREGPATKPGSAVGEASSAPLDGFLAPSGTSPPGVARPLCRAGSGRNTNEEER